MKKQILNHFIVGVLALLTVVGLQSFELKTDKREKVTNFQSCPGDFVWYYVKLSTSIDCAEPGSISISDLELHETNGGTPLEDMEDFVLDQLTIESESGCDEFKVYTCAVGYDPENSNFSNQIVSGRWVPTSPPVCVICRD